MQHNFNVFLAQMYSVDEAIFLQHIHFWYLHNKSNNKNFYDNRYWTYNSVSAFSEQFIYLSEKQIRNILTKLETKGLIVTGNYNKIGYDRTKWYSLTEKSLEILENLGIHKEQEVKSKSNLKKENTNLQNGNFDLPKRENGFTQKGEPIPYLNSNLNKEELKENNILINKNITKENINLEKKDIVLFDSSQITNQLEIINQIPNIIDLYDTQFENSINENKYKIAEYYNSAEKKDMFMQYNKLRRNLPMPKPKNRETLIDWNLKKGKIRVATNLYMYPYEALALKLVFGADYLSRKIQEYDSYFENDNKFKMFTDHYTNIKNWLIEDVEKQVAKANNIFDRYYYYRSGVKKDEIL